MDVRICRIADLSSHFAYEIFRLRQDVFIVEQKGICRDIDDADLTAWHVFAVGPISNVIGYCRLTEHLADFWRLQRVVVTPLWRRKGVASGMLSETILHARRQNAPGIMLNAQLHALSIYQRQGFETSSEIYDDGGTPHVAMRLRFR